MERADQSRAMKEELVALRTRLADPERRLGAATEIEAPLPVGVLDVLSCRVGDERVAILLREVREVVPIAAVAALPEAPPWVLGLLQLGPNAVPVLDVGSRFERRPRAIAASDLIVVCRHSPTDIGLVVQEVNDVVRIDAGEVAAPSRDIAHAPYLRGTFRDADGAVLVLGLRSFVENAGVPGLDPSEDA